MSEDEIKQIVMTAFNEIGVPTGRGPDPFSRRTMPYYAGVGMDHFGHPYENVQVLMEMIAGSVAEAIAKKGTTTS